MTIDSGSSFETVKDIVKKHQISRVVHFTPAMNLHHIVEDGGIRPNSELADSAADYFQPTDLLRRDSHPEMTCVSFTYPNPFYFDAARKKEHLIRVEDWVCLLIDSDVLTRDGALFSPCNAATGSGGVLLPGAEGLEKCFASPTLFGRERGSEHHPSCATDLQAEALLPGEIPLSAVNSVVTPDERSARNARARLNAADLDFNQFQWRISPVMFQKWPLANAIRNGESIAEDVLSQKTGGNDAVS